MVSLSIVLPYIVLQGLILTSYIVLVRRLMSSREEATPELETQTITEKTEFDPIDPDTDKPRWEVEYE